MKAPIRLRLLTHFCRVPLLINLGNNGSEKESRLSGRLTEIHHSVGSCVIFKDRLNPGDGRHCWTKDIPFRGKG